MRSISIKEIAENLEVDIKAYGDNKLSPEGRRRLLFLKDCMMNVEICDTQNTNEYKPLNNISIEDYIPKECSVGDVERYEKLKNLMGKWKDYIDKSFPNRAKTFYTDGFYPFYTNQEVKILFVGREACLMSGRHYIQSELPHIQNSNFNGWTLDQYPFHRRQFYIAYGIMEKARTGKFPDWNDVPWASDMAQKMGTAEGMSWAFMNLSKFSNDTDDFRTDPERYNLFVQDEGNREFIRNEINILAPNFIIGSNVGNLVDILGYDAEPVDRRNTNCFLYKDNYANSLPPFLDCYHFSAFNKSDKDCYYNAIKDVVSRNNLLCKTVGTEFACEMAKGGVLK